MASGGVPVCVLGVLCGDYTADKEEQVTTFFDVESEDAVPFSERFIWDIDGFARMVHWLSTIHPDALEQADHVLTAQEMAAITPLLNGVQAMEYNGGEFNKQALLDAIDKIQELQELG